MRERSGDGMRLFVCSIIAAAAAMLYFGSCLSFAREAENIQTGTDAEEEMSVFSAESRVEDVARALLFAPYGRLLFPVQSGYMDGDTLGSLRLTWYSHISPARTVAVVNRLAADAAAGHRIFYPIYTEEEMRRDPAKRDTGLFFFRGRTGAPVAVVSAGGGFAYVGAMQDSFPHALVLSERGVNAFALIYRPRAQTACEDLSRAVAFLHEHAAELGVDMRGYSLWGGSAGARMAAWVGSHGTEAFGQRSYPRPAAVIMQYTDLSEVYGTEPPTYSCVGTADGIASWQTMQRRTQAIRRNGQAAEIEVFKGLPHGFGLGEGTAAEGWLNRAADFWIAQR